VTRNTSIRFAYNVREHRVVERVVAPLALTTLEIVTLVPRRGQVDEELRRLRVFGMGSRWPGFERATHGLRRRIHTR
jgi:hypothetical protein